ncbi:MAG: hypothetical protein SFY68_09135 [Candidatus Sumerlaeia bacterium]|nr:hypothetical protein [Candidatus Sumerlaeia bacterium]
MKSQYFRDPFRWAVAVVFFAFVMVWGWSQLRFHTHVGRVDRVIQSGEAPAFTALKPPLPLSPQENRLGRFLLEELFPPSFVEAEEAYIRALHSDPLSSLAWLRLAEVYLYKGDTTRARLALLRSDTLDPRYPRERLEAIRLWVLLGEPEKALELGSRMASLGGVNPRLALKELVEARFPFEDISQHLNFEERTPSELRQIFLYLREEQPRKFAEAVQYLPESKLQDAGLLTSLARFAVELNEAPVARDLWFRQNPQPVVLASRLMIPDPLLLATPFRERFPLGWNNPDEEKRLLRWRTMVEPDASGLLGTALVWEWTPRDLERVAIPLGRFLLEPGEKRAVHALLSVEGLSAGSLQFEWEFKGEYRYSQGDEIASGIPLLASFNVPERSEASLVQLNLWITPKTLESNSRRLRVALYGLAENPSAFEGKGYEPSGAVNTLSERGE